MSLNSTNRNFPGNERPAIGFVSKMKQNYLDSRSKKVQRHPHNKENMMDETKSEEVRQVADRRNIKVQ